MRRLREGLSGRALSFDGHGFMRPLEPPYIGILNLNHLVMGNAPSYTPPPPPAPAPAPHYQPPRVYNPPTNGQYYGQYVPGGYQPYPQVERFDACRFSHSLTRHAPLASIDRRDLISIPSILRANTHPLQPSSVFPQLPHLKFRMPKRPQ